jgi:N-alpha-acetyltransferase 15/16, NatA auxiliary subunit
LEVAKVALIKSKMRSMFCWHTCASIYKQKKDFVEAAKAFQNALKLEPDNLQIMREAASLQVQVRDLTNHTASRFNILKQKPGMIQNWIAFAISHHLVRID